MTELPASYAFAMLITIAVIHFGKRGLPNNPWEYGWFAIAGLLFWWCLKPLRSDALVDSDAHDEPNKSVAFRLGKLFKRTLFRSPRRR